MKYYAYVSEFLEPTSNGRTISRGERASAMVRNAVRKNIEFFSEYKEYDEIFELYIPDFVNFIMTEYYIICSRNGISYVITPTEIKCDLQSITIEM